MNYMHTLEKGEWVVVTQGARKGTIWQTANRKGSTCGIVVHDEESPSKVRYFQSADVKKISPLEMLAGAADVTEI